VISRLVLSALVVTALVVTAALVPVGVGEASAATCRQPGFVTSKPHGRWSTGQYWVDNNVWNGRGHQVRQRLRACSGDSWDVRVRIGKPHDTWSVKSYPNVHRDWHDWSHGDGEPRLSRFHVLRSSFSTRVPSSGIHNTAYDLWLDGVPGVPGVREVMVWTASHGMQPSGHVIRRGLRLGGRTWTVWSNADGSYVAFVPRRDFHAGTVRLRAHLGWLQRRGRLPANATLGQVGFGFEVIATDERRLRFRVDGFSLTAR
jgi:hypothetical protein